MPQPRRLIIIAKFRPFDELTWKRLLIAYAYALYDRKTAAVKRTITADEATT